MFITILQQIGFEPIEVKPHRIKYQSPFNPSEKTPSFFLFTNKKWNGEDKLKEFNFSCKSTAQGGDIYKFVQLYYNLNFSGSKRKLNELLGIDYQEPNRPTQTKPHSFSFNQELNRPKTEETIKIVKSQPLQNKALFDYINQRGISSTIAKRYLGEVYYKIENKSYFALSFLTDTGGREIRNKYFKGALGKKGISYLKPTPSNRLKLFEGFMDFLSYQELTQESILSHFIILNSASLREQALRAITANYEHIELYLDNDKAGDETTRFFINNLGESKTNDKRRFYKEYKDVNEFLVKKCTV